MGEFNPLNINGYSFDELKDFLLSEKVTFQQMQQLGLNWKMQEKVKEWLEEIDGLKKEEDLFWKVSCDTNTKPAYLSYLERYPDGRYVAEAKVRIAMIDDEFRRKVTALIEDMRKSPWKYTAEIMSMLFNGVSPSQMETIKNAPSDTIDSVIRDFIISDMRLPYEKLLEEHIIPAEVSQNDICAPDYRMPQKKINELGSFPTDRTDVYFLGVPRSGKSSVLSGIMYKLFIEGRAAYEPHLVNGIDPCASYYRGLIKAMSSKKPPVGTPSDSIRDRKSTRLNSSHL